MEHDQRMLLWSASMECFALEWSQQTVVNFHNMRQHVAVVKLSFFLCIMNKVVYTEISCYTQMILIYLTELALYNWIKTGDISFSRG